MALEGERSMEQSHWKISCLISLFTIFAFFYVSEAGNDESSVILYDFKLPEYNKENGALEYIIYGDKAHSIGVIINLEKLKIEWIGKDTSDIKGTVTTPKGVYDRSTKVIRGDEEVHFNSATMEGDGVGFDADQKVQTLHVRSKVKVVLRENLLTEKEKTAGKVSGTVKNK